jgi:predicted enzyme related to lactoylglutathione lyase
MPLARWKDLCPDASDAPRAAAFWSVVLGLTMEVQDNGDAVLRGDRPEQGMWFNTVPEPKTVKNRVHLDLVHTSLEPFTSAGATIVGEQRSSKHAWTVLADPEGNELCVFPGEPGEPTALVVDAADPAAQAEWWSEVLGATVLTGPDGVPRWLEVDGLPWDVWKFVPVPDPKTVKNRWHWDLVSDDVPGFLDRGATLLRKPDGDIDWHVLADPEGNEFCVFTS